MPQVILAEEGLSPQTLEIAEHLRATEDSSPLDRGGYEAWQSAPGRDWDLGASQTQLSPLNLRLTAAVKRPSEDLHFKDMAVAFSQEEWGLLDEAQRLLYCDVMLRIYGLVASMGFWHESEDQEALSEHSVSVEGESQVRASTTAPATQNTHPLQMLSSDRGMPLERSPGEKTGPGL
ncbi:zinc finger protein 549-like [Molossus nigricans]